jgi:diguanylate cyclase (GGDEF)-like protein
MHVHRTHPAPQLPSPPIALARVIRIAGDPNRALAELGRACEQDPVLTLELIRVANSACYANARPITSVPQAVVKLGARAVRNHALTFALRTSTAKCHTGGFNARRFWEDSLRRGCAARRIAEAMGDEDPNEAFAVGICQDLGTLLLAIRCPELGETLDALRRRPGEARRQAERVLSGHDHCEELIASPLITMLPTEMQKAISMHHTPDRRETRASRLSRIAWAADRLADVAQAFPKSVVLDRVTEAFGALGLEDRLREIYSGLRRDMADDAVDLSIPVDEQPTLAGIQDQARAAMAALSTEQHEWNSKLRDQLRESVSSGGAATQTVRRRMLGSRDSLTALDNRRRFEERLQEAVEDAMETSLPLTLIIGDIDHFKRVNDTWGHGSGDAVLQGVAVRLSGFARDDDAVGRVGGEEFGMLLPETGAEAAQVLAERIRLRVCRDTIDCGANHVTVTISLGGTTWDPATGLVSGLELLERADRALHQAKRSGRDQVCWQEPAANPARAAG